MQLIVLASPSMDSHDYLIAVVVKLVCLYCSPTGSADWITEHWTRLNYNGSGCSTFQHLVNNSGFHPGKQDELICGYHIDNIIVTFLYYGLPTVLSVVRYKVCCSAKILTDVPSYLCHCMTCPHESLLMIALLFVIN